MKGGKYAWPLPRAGLKLQLGRGCNFVFRSGSELLINICSYTPNKKCLDFKMKRTFRLAELSKRAIQAFRTQKHSDYSHFRKIQTNTREENPLQTL